ncbi:hypothetical protein V6N13_074354 [Hibiscus sabdariffa]|uniref:Uncharacterized protein n=1 Tax=Hibiscus sabdariffa TaxID=183260 RepID=A0ABR2U886_9ROSI
MIRLMDEILSVAHNTEHSSYDLQKIAIKHNIVYEFTAKMCTSIGDYQASRLLQTGTETETNDGSWVTGNEQRRRTSGERVVVIDDCEKESER